MISPRDVLGINARSLLYIRKYNSQKATAIADSKLKTKKFLQARGIRVPKLVATFRSLQDITEQAIRKLPADIVIKPNDSSGGSGIVVLTEKRPFGWMTVSGKRFTYRDMEEHLQSILQGAFHHTGYRDIALVEKRIITHSKLQGITYKGLPDIRIIVFNLVPVLAMLRLPTAASDGKANLHSGGICAGIDMSKAEVTYLLQYDQLIHEVPGIGSLTGFTIPFWDEILRMAVQAQYITNIGFLGVDIALDRTGPILLEVNARPGLMVQVANLVPLRKRLRRVEGLKVKSVARGIAIAKALFGRKLEKDIKALSGRTIIGNKEYITLHLPGGTRQFQAKINPRVSESFIDADLAKTLTADHPSLETETGALKIRYQLLDRKSQTLFQPLAMGSSTFDIIIGKRELKNVLIDPYKYDKTELPQRYEEPAVRQPRTKLKKKEIIQTWRETDRKLSRIEKLVSKHFSLQPLNYSDELQTFIAEKGNYNPQFVYKEDNDMIAALRDELQKIYISQDDVRGMLFAKKHEHMLLKLDFFEACGKDGEQFTELSEQLFARPSQECSIKAHELLVQFEKQRHHFPPRERVGPKEAIPHIFEHLKKYGLDKTWHVIERNHGARMAVSKSKKRQIFVREDSSFTLKDTPLLFAHELDTHVLRLENGLNQPYLIFANGTADYLETEEGLAIYNQNMHTGIKDVKYYTAALSYTKTLETIQLSFADAVESNVKQAVFRHEEERKNPLPDMFRRVYRAKRGIGDTSKPGGCTRDLVYFTGLQKVQYFLKHGGDITQLYKGKIDLSSVPLVSQMEELVDPLHIPPYYS